MQNSFSRDAMFLAAMAACESTQDRVGPKLLRMFPSAEAVWNAPAEMLLRGDISPETIARFVHERSLKNPEAIAEQCEKTGCVMVSMNDAEYPALLKQITFPPFVLFVRGTIPAETVPTLAVVGTRTMTHYGDRIIRDIVPPLARAGVMIVSGLAYGCDTLAHRVTVDAQGITIAVLGGGVDEATITPSTNRMLARDIIASGGAIMSAYPPGTEPRKYTFPQRNRVIAGISQATLVIEAPESSGALITARHALEENRDVMAVPGSIYEKNSVGTNELIARGARSVRSVDDVLSAMMLSELESVQKQLPLRSDPKEQIIIDACTHEPVSTDIIIQKAGLPTHETLALISRLELEGVVIRTNDGKIRV